MHLALRLLGAGVPSARIRIVDPHSEPLVRWRRYTGNTGMTHLRSPQVHNLGLKALELEELAATEEYKAIKRRLHGDEASTSPDFIDPYERPSLALFEHHATRLIESAGLMRNWRQGAARSIERRLTGFEVTLDSGERLSARNVVLALGAADQLHLPEWALDLRAQDEHASVHHIFESGFHREQIGPQESVVLIGAGISSAQLALSLVEESPRRRVMILSRHSLRQSDFDSDPGWLGPLFLTEFDAEECPSERRAIIDRARKPGSLAADVMHDISQALRAGRVIHTLAHVMSANPSGHGAGVGLRIRPVELDEEAYHRTGEIVSKVSESIRSLSADRVVLCTGFKTGRPGGRFVQQAVERLSLPLAPDGFPFPDAHLRWAPGLFVMGPLAELVVGPAARNLSGARMAAERILASAELLHSPVNGRKASSTPLT